MLLHAQDVPLRSGVQVFEVVSDRAFLVGKAFDQARPIARPASEGTASSRPGEMKRSNSSVIGFHSERAAREKVDEGTNDRPLFDTADIMEADLPAHSIAAEYGGLPPALPVLLQHQHLHFADLGEKARGSTFRRSPSR